MGDGDTGRNGVKERGREKMERAQEGRKGGKREKWRREVK